MRSRNLTAVKALSLALVGYSLPMLAQEVLPAPPPPFKGRIGLSAKDSTPDFPPTYRSSKKSSQCRLDTVG